LYSGTGSSQDITGYNFSPDFAWIKNRNSTGHHSLFDTVRGATKIIYSNLTNAENTIASSLSAFNNNGFTVVSDNDVNGSSRTYAAWAWDAGTSTVTNNDGSIASQVRANPSAGFSIVTYTGTGASNATVGHGLNTTPSLLIHKYLNKTENWDTWVTGLTADQYLALSTTGGTTTYSGHWGSLPTSSVFGVSGSRTNAVNTKVTYCFAPVEGYSSMGSYVGNGSADGVFIYTGFAPSWLLFKRSDSTSDWSIYDTARDPHNVAGDKLEPNTSDAESAEGAVVDILSNGFKFRRNSLENGGNDVYIYMAFASHPFKSARAR
jgi:hypothetical protein